MDANDQDNQQALQFRRVEQALRESEEPFRRIFENGPIGMVLIDLELRVTKINSAFGRILGYGPDVTGRPLTDFVYPADVLPLIQHLKKMFAKPRAAFQVEIRFFTKSGEAVWVGASGAVIHTSEGSPNYAVIIFENINERKLAESKLNEYQEQLQSLASELSLSEERERRRIATVLHDRIGQTLAFAKLKLGSLAHSASISESRANVVEIRKLIEQAIADARSLTFELSPPVLYELGLIAALEWLAQKTTQEQGLTTDFQDDGEPKPLDEKFKVVLFQAARELLINVVKHAQAKHIQLSVSKDGDAIRIVIEDDGIGFDLSKIQAAGQGKGFGLFNIRERLDYLGGQVKIRSELNRGTRITLLAPLYDAEGGT